MDVRNPGGLNKTRVSAGRAKRMEFLRVLIVGMPLGKACEHVGWTRSAYRSNRGKWADWAAECDLALFGQEARRPTNRDTGHGIPWVPGDGFARFRLLFLGRETPAFQQQMITTFEESKPGSVTLVLAPPGAGKTAFYEDADIYWTCANPDINILVASESREHAGKIVSTVRAHFEHEADGMGALRERFGPFAPPRGAGKNYSKQTWGAFGFSVAKRRPTHGREITMRGIGIGSSVIGSRCDVLQLDDPQSTDTISGTEKLVEKFRQDLLSRPLGTSPEMGRTLIVMNRVGEGDFPEYLLEQTDLVDHVIKIPAWTDDGGWYWPEVYPHERMMLIKEKAGPDAWDRNFMQLGIGSRNQAFTDATIARGKNSLRSINHPPPKPPDGGVASIVLSMDPGFGVTAIHAGAVEPARFRSCDFRIYRDVDSYADYGGILEQSLRQFTVPGVSVVRWVQIETKAFQKGLIRDEKILELRREYGFELQPVETGAEKNDENLGIPVLKRMLERDELDFPDMDAVSQDRYRDLYRQLRRWRPFVRGNKLEQDVVMTLWFGAMLWRRLHRTVASNNSDWSFRGLSR